MFRMKIVNLQGELAQARSRVADLQAKKETRIAEYRHKLLVEACNLRALLAAKLSKREALKRLKATLQTITQPPREKSPLVRPQDRGVKDAPGSCPEDG